MTDEALPCCISCTNVMGAQQQAFFDGVTPEKLARMVIVSTLIALKSVRTAGIDGIVDALCPACRDRNRRIEFDARRSDVPEKAS